MSTRLGTSLMSILYSQGMKQTDMAEKCQLSQPTINKIMSKPFRVDESTLRKITNALSPDLNACLLIAHLEDEIDRAGHKIADYDIKRNPKKFAKKVEHAMHYIGSHINHDPTLAELIIDLVVMLEKSEPKTLYEFEAGTGLKNVAEKD